jgi:hypothetical protein
MVRSGNESQVTESIEHSLKLGLWFQVSGVRFQVSGEISMGHSAWSMEYKNFEIVNAESCWSEAEIPSEAKRQRETLKPET